MRTMSSTPSKKPTPKRPVEFAKLATAAVVDALKAVNQQK